MKYRFVCINNHTCEQYKVNLEACHYRLMVSLSEINRLSHCTARLSVKTSAT